jgi:hypothetical protein
VHSDRCVNLAVFDARDLQMAPGLLTSMPLVQPEDEIPEHGPFAEWMPYQVNQAAKHAEAAN